MLIRTLYRKFGKKQVFLANSVVFLASVTSACAKGDVLHCLCFCSNWKRNVMQYASLVKNTSYISTVKPLLWINWIFSSEYFYLGLLILQCKCCQWSAKGRENTSRMMTISVSQLEGFGYKHCCVGGYFGSIWEMEIMAAAGESGTRRWRENQVRKVDLVTS